MNTQKEHADFTLTELMIVTAISTIAIIGGLVSLILPNRREDWHLSA